MACLDTTALLDLSGRSGRRSRERARSKAAALQAAGESLVTTRLNVAELWVGVYRSQDRDAEIRKVDRVVRPLSILDLDGRSAEVFGSIVAGLRNKGRDIGDMDALIASICLVAGHSVLTRNTGHFGRIPGLVVETY